MFARLAGTLLIALLLLSGLPLSAQDAAPLPETMYVLPEDAPAFSCVGEDCERLARLPAGAVVTVIGQAEGPELAGSALWYKVQLDCPCFDFEQRELLEPPDTKDPDRNLWASWQPYFSPDGTRIATVAGSVLYVWDAVSGERLVNAPLDLFHARTMAWSPDGTRIVAGGGAYSEEDGEQSHEPERNLLIVDDDGRSPMRLSGQDKSIAYVSWSHDGTRIAAAGDEMRIWDAQLGTTLLSIDAYMHCAAWSPDDTRLVTDSHDGGLQLRDSSSGEVLSALDIGDDIHLNGALWSPEGTQIAYVINLPHTINDVRTEFNPPYGSLRLWDGVAREPSAPLVEAEDWILGLSWSPDGRFLVYGADWEISILDTEDGRTLARLLTNPGEYAGGFLGNSLAWSPDGDRIAAGGFAPRDMKIMDASRLWELTLVPDQTRAWMHSSLLGDEGPGG